MKPFIVAEIGGNHLGSLGTARTLLRAAAQAGADAVKLQCWTIGTMVLDPKLTYSGRGPWQGQSLAGLYALTFTPWYWFPTLFQDAADLGIELFASAFDRGAVDYLETFHVKRHKISSFELVDLDLISYAASTRKPLILSTGMATRREIDEALIAADKAETVTLLRCVSGYPSDPSEAGLALLPDLADMGDASGVSDHTLGNAVAIAAAALGASMIEKHFTLNRADGGPDASFSLEPAEFELMVSQVRQAAAACRTTVDFGPQPSEREHVALRRSLYWSHDLPAGHIISPDDMVTARPALGLSPNSRHEVTGRMLLHNVKKGAPVDPLIATCKVTGQEIHR